MDHVAVKPHPCSTFLNPYSPRMSTSRREAIARAVPGIVAAVCSLFWFTEKSILGRVLLAAVSGFVLYGIGLVAYLLAGYVIARVAGRERESAEMVRPDMRTTAAALLFVGMWFLGQHWVRSREREILRCVSVRQQGAASAGNFEREESHREVVESCLAADEPSTTADE